MNDDNEGFEIAEIVPYKIVDTIPSAYRLMKKASGELVLQGAYEWQEGQKHGYEWQDIPTVMEADV
jgi:hypothetical protein